MRDLRFEPGSTDCTPEEASYDAHWLEHLEDHLRASVVARGHQATGYLLSRKGKIFAHSAMGSLRHDAPSALFRTHSLHRLSSLTSIFTVAAAFRQIERGRLDMEQEVKRFLPEFAAEGLSDLRIGHLMTNTAGLEAFPNAWVATHDHPVFQHLQDPSWLARLVARTAHSPAGGRWGYSPMALSVLARIIELVSDRAFEDLVMSKIAKPLGMVDTMFDVTGDFRPRMCTIGAEPPIGARGGAPRGGSGLYATMQDMHAFARLFLNQESRPQQHVLSNASIDAMRRDHTKRLWIHSQPTADGSPLLPGWRSIQEDLLASGSIGMDAWGWSSVHIDPARDFVCILFLPGRVEFDRRCLHHARSIAWAGLR